MCPPGLDTHGQGLLFCSAGQGDMARMLDGGDKCCRAGPGPAPLPASQLSQGASLWLCLAHRCDPPRWRSLLSQPRGQRGASAALPLPLPGQSLQKLLPDPWASAELRKQLAEPGALSGARQHEKNAGISQRHSCGRRNRAGRWVVCLLEALLGEVRLFQEP